MILNAHPFTHNINIECYDNIEFEKVLPILKELENKFWSEFSELKKMTKNNEVLK